jgi:hypothetical protein
VQSATADAAAAQPQQSNAVEAARIDSLGGETAAQQNDVSVVGAAANAASTSQAADSGAPPADGGAQAGQEATADQAANAAAAAAQPQQSNIVIIIRINSPGDDVVSQTNVVSVVAVAADQSWINQNPAPAVGSVPGTTDPAQSPSGTSSAPATAPQPVVSSDQPAQSSGAEQQRQQPGDLVQQLHPQSVRALSILTFAASSNANPPVPGHQASSPATSAGRTRLGGAARRSGAFGPNTEASEGSGGASVDRQSIQTSRAEAHRTGTQSASGKMLDALRDGVAGWLGRTPVAAGPQLGADNSGGLGVGLLTVTCSLLVGLLGWAALTWPPFSRR